MYQQDTKTLCGDHLIQSMRPFSQASFNPDQWITFSAAPQVYYGLGVNVNPTGLLWVLCFLHAAKEGRANECEWKTTLCDGTNSRKGSCFFVFFFSRKQQRQKHFPFVVLQRVEIQHAWACRAAIWTPLELHFQRIAFVKTTKHQIQRTCGQKVRVGFFSSQFHCWKCWTVDFFQAFLICHCHSFLPLTTPWLYLPRMILWD